MGKHIDGIRTATGWRVFVRVHGVPYSKRFPPEATITQRRDWRARQRMDAKTAARKATEAQPEPGSFAEDVLTYLAAVKAMPTYDWRKKDLEHWTAAIGDTRARNSITSHEIRTVLSQWRLTGKNGKALSASACNHRRTALMHFYSVLNGKAGENPVKGVPRFREPDPQPRGVSRATLAKILAQMPESATKARVMVMAYTGLPAMSVAQLLPSSVDLANKQVTVPRRRKGAGTKTRVLEITPEAVKAFKMLDRFDGWGPFSRDSLRKSLKLACRKAEVPEMRGYDLRHSFATQLYQASGDIHAVQAVLDHSDPKLTARYTLGAVDQRVSSALAAWRKVTTKVTGKRKKARSA